MCTTQFGKQKGNIRVESTANETKMELICLFTLNKFFLNIGLEKEKVIEIS